MESQQWEREDGETTCEMNEKHAKKIWTTGRCRNLGGYENPHIHHMIVLCFL